jgi:hypothetical protein
MNIAQSTWGMPKQKVSSSAKTDAWGRECVDAIIGMSGQLTSGGRTSQTYKQVNYDLVNGIFDEEDMKYVTDPYGIAGELGNQPARMTCYPIIPAKLNLLDGEELKRPFNFRAICVGGAGSAAREEKKIQMILEHYKAKLYQNLGITPEMEQEEGFQTPAQIAKWVDVKYEDMREQLANGLLRYLKFKEDLKMKFNKGFKHAKICAEELYYVGKSGGKPTVRVVNPIYFDFDRNPEIEYIEDASWAKEERYMSLGEVIDEYAEYLSDEQIDKIEQGNVGFGYGNQSMISAATMTYVPQDNNHSKRTQWQGRQTGICVTTAVWKSLEKIGFLTYTDELGEPQETLVKDNFTLSPELKAAGATLEWEWKTVVYQGVRIGDSSDGIYPIIEPLPNQVDGKLPYVGAIYNNLNSIATSLVDYMKPHQYLYNIVWYRLELELAKAKGKKFIMDMAQLPKSQGWTTEQWMYYFDNLGVAWINSLEEGGEGMAGRVASYNQFREVDMSLSQSVGQYINILNKLEDMVGELVGVTKQREGQTAASETLGGVERSVVQSSMITEPLFIKHNQVKQRVITHLLEVAKLCYSEGGKIDFLDEDLLRTVLEIDGDLLNDSDFGIFVTDATTEQHVFEKLQGVAQQALQAQAISLSELITVFKSQSLSEVENIIRAGENKRQAMSTQQQEADREAQAQAQQAQLAAEQEARAFQASENQKDRDARIQEAMIKGMGFAKDTDLDKDGQPDIIEQGDLILRERELEHKHAQERTKQSDDAIDKQQKNGLAAEKLRIEVAKLQKEQETFKREQDQQDKQNAIDAQKHKAELAMKAAELKMKMHELKMKEKELADKDKDRKQKAVEGDMKIQEKAMDIEVKEAEHRAKMQETKNKIEESNQKIKESKAKTVETEKKTIAAVYKMKNTPKKTTTPKKKKK